MSLVSTADRTVKLVYAMRGAGAALSANITLTFSPAPALNDNVLAPKVPSVVTGSVIPVTYDISHAAHVSSPLLTISMPGRLNDWTGIYFNPAYAVPLSAPKGTIDIPVDKLQGGGIYSVQICLTFGGLKAGTSSEFQSDPAITRVEPQAAEKRAPAPLLSFGASKPGHSLEIPYGKSFRLEYDVTRIPGATGADLEISFPSPTNNGNAWLYNTFDNPNGTIRDDNGVDYGSIYFQPLSGTSGTITLDPKKLELKPTMYEQIRIIPVKESIATGEASDADTIMMDGVAPADGGSVALSGFGINSHGRDGFLTSNQTLASGQPLSSVETFDQSDNAIKRVVASQSGEEAFTAPPFIFSGPGVFGHDVGLFGLFAPASQTVSYSLLDPVSRGTLGPPWLPPAQYAGINSLSDILGVAPNQVNDTIAVLAQNPTAPSADQWQVFTSQLLSSVAGKTFDISSQVSSANYANPAMPLGLSEDTSSRIVYAPLYDASQECFTSSIVTVNLETGKTGSFPGVRSIGNEAVSGTLAIDPVTHKALANTSPGCVAADALYDLSKGSGTLILPHGYFNDYFLSYDAVDTLHQLFLGAWFTSYREPVQFKYPVIGEGNNNTLNSVFVMDEDGRFKKNLEEFNLGRVYVGRAQDLQINPSTRTGYILSWNGDLVPFAY